MPVITKTLRSSHASIGGNASTFDNGTANDKAAMDTNMSIPTNEVYLKEYSAMLSLYGSLRKL